MGQGRSRLVRGGARSTIVTPCIDLGCRAPTPGGLERCCGAASPRGDHSGHGFRDTSIAGWSGSSVAADRRPGARAICGPMRPRADRSTASRARHRARSAAPPGALDGAPRAPGAAARRRRDASPASVPVDPVRERGGPPVAVPCGRPSRTERVVDRRPRASGRARSNPSADDTGLQRDGRIRWPGAARRSRTVPSAPRQTPTGPPTFGRPSDPAPEVTDAQRSPSTTPDRHARRRGGM